MNLLSQIMSEEANEGANEGALLVRVARLSNQPTLYVRRNYSRNSQGVSALLSYSSMDCGIWI